MLNILKGYNPNIFPSNIPFIHTITLLFGYKISNHNKT